MVQISHRGHTIKVDRQECLAGYDLLYFTIIRDDDGFFVEDNYTTEETPEAEYAEGLRERVDNEIADFEKWCERFFESLAAHFCLSIEEVRSMHGCDNQMRKLRELQKSYDDGESADSAAWDEYEAACALD